jgi:hypothetical protein
MRRIGPLIILLVSHAMAQKIPDVRCVLDNYNVDSVIYWQAPFKVGKVQVAVLRDPAGEQEARFDLTHGATLISLRFKGKELLYGQSAGAGINLYVPRRGPENELQQLSPYWSSYSPTQGHTSMGIPSTVSGVACNGQQSFRAFSMMVDRAQDSSFQKEPLLAVWKGRISDSFPPGYATPFAVETNASWIENPGGSPKYYLKLDQSVVNVRPEPTPEMEWFLEGAAPWGFLHAASSATNHIAGGWYRDQKRTTGLAVAMSSSNFHKSQVGGSFNSDYMWRNRNFHLTSSEALDGVARKYVVWHVMPGSWSSALSFAKALR